MDFHLVALRIDLDVTRLQRAGEAGQSPASGDHAVERRRCGTVARANAVDELGDLGERHEGGYADEAPIPSAVRLSTPKRAAGRGLIGTTLGD